MINYQVTLFSAVGRTERKIIAPNCTKAILTALRTLTNHAPVSCVICKPAERPVL